MPKLTPVPLDAKQIERARLLNFAIENVENGNHYAQIPVQIEEFCLSDNFLNCGDVIRPQVLRDLKDLFCNEKVFAYCPYEEAVFNEAIGSGKSFKTGIIISYYLYHLFCLRNPHAYFQIGRETLISVMNMSINATQAKKVVFGEVRSRILNAPWFIKGHKPDENVRSELRFANNIGVIPGQSGSTYPLGFSLICAVMDEAAFYTQTSDHDVAEDMFYALKRRIKGRFGDKGLLIMISSPRYVDDFIEQKSKEAENDPTIFCRRHAIWEVVEDDIASIREGRSFELEGTTIPIRYKKDFDKNPEKSWRDLGARPSLTLEPYFKMWSLVEEGIDKTLSHPVDESGRLYDWFRGEPRYAYAVHIDLALSKDACGFALGHLEGDSKPVIDMMLRIKAPKNGEIDISDVKNYIYELKQRGFNIFVVTYDQYQSASSIQELNKKGYNATKLSVDANLAPYDTLKEVMYQKMIRYYRYDIFMDECRRLELKEGKKVDHPPNGSKDVSDAVAGVVYNLITSKRTSRVVTGRIL